uniref:MIF4G domain-containing protein n=1 Tax=Globodera pallida TaxID=36090 RepID=A0A183BI24_GLOPA
MSIDQISLLPPLNSNETLASVYRWLFDELRQNDIGTIALALRRLLEKVKKGIILESEDERKIVNGIGQMLRVVQQKTLGQMAADRQMTEHGILEQLWRHVDKVKARNPFLAKTLAVWVERMPHLVERLFDCNVGAKFCNDLVEMIRTFCGCLIHQKSVFTSSWEAFCVVLSKLEQKEKAQLDEEFARFYGREEKMWAKLSPVRDGTQQKESGHKPPRSVTMNLQENLNVPTLDLNASRLMKKRVTKTDEHKVPKLELQVKIPELNVPILDLSAGRLTTKR